jgi:hypothetical protein
LAGGFAQGLELGQHGRRLAAEEAQAQLLDFDGGIPIRLSTPNETSASGETLSSSISCPGR